MEFNHPAINAMTLSALLISIWVMLVILYKPIKHLYRYHFHRESRGVERRVTDRRTCDGAEAHFCSDYADVCKKHNMLVDSGRDGIPYVARVDPELLRHYLGALADDVDTDVKRLATYGTEKRNKTERRKAVRQN